MTHRMLRCYVAKVAEVRGDLVPKEVLFKKLLEDEFALVSTKATTSRGFCIFASPGLWRNEERLQSFTNAVAQCIYESGFHPDSCAYVVMFPTVSPEEWRGHRISLQGNAFKCLKFPSDLSFQIFPDSAFPVAPYNSWLASLDSVTREVRLRNKITAPSETVTSETISLALSTMQLTEASLCQVKNVADVKVVHRTFYFLSTFGVTLSELVGVGHKDQTALRVKLVLLAGNWAIFSHKKHPLLQDSEMRKAATQTLDFFTAMSSDSKLLDQLSDQDFAFFSSSASLCLRDVTDTETLISSHGENAFEPVFYQAHRGTETPRGQRVMMGIQRLDERQRVSTKAGRVLDTHSSSMDLNLARLSSEAPKARVKWQRGRFISKGATGSVTF